MRTFKMAKGWAIFIYVTVPPMIALFAWLLIMPFVPSMNDGTSNQIYWLLAPLSIGMIGLLAVGLLDAIKAKFIIDTNSVSITSTFTNRQLMYDEIKGYRVT